MIRALGEWLAAASAAALGATVIQLVTPTMKNGLERYVKFVSGAVVLLIFITPLFSFLSEINDFFDNSGIIRHEQNIYITEEPPTSKWILSETLTELEKGIVKLVRQKYGVGIKTEFDTDISDSGIEIKAVIISCDGITYGIKTEIADFLRDYLGVEVRVKSNE
ncbi:MAG: hypothetical protein E7588_05585 [Ruminococcaceae bacterium]|nr:hypothetical protein [Oscillospiraceae bacterium]